MWLATRRSERLALHPASATKNGISTVSASLDGPALAQARLRFDRSVAWAAQHAADGRVNLHTPAGQALRRVRIGAQHKQDTGRARGVGNDGSMKRPERRQHITRLQKMGANLQNVRVAERQR